MQRIRSLANKFQKRTLRPLYGQTQAYPYAAVLDPSLYDGTGTFIRPLNGDGDRTADAFVLKGGLVPGTVVQLGAGEGVVVHDGVNPGAAGGNAAFGLLANFVGGELDDLLGGETFVGVWRGPDSVFEVLAPAFNDTGLSAAYAAATAGNQVPLYAGTDGRLTYISSAGNRGVVAYLIERPSATRIVVDLKV